MPQITEAIMEIQKSLAKIETDVSWIKKNATTQKEDTQNLCVRVDDLETWQNKANGALTVLEILMAGLGFTLILKIFEVI
jgi:hypothetical protein